MTMTRAQFAEALRCLRSLDGYEIGLIGEPAARFVAQPEQFFLASPEPRRVLIWGAVQRRLRDGERVVAAARMVA